MTSRVELDRPFIMFLTPLKAPTMLMDPFDTDCLLDATERVRPTHAHKHTLPVLAECPFALPLVPTEPLVVLEVS